MSLRYMGIALFAALMMLAGCSGNVQVPAQNFESTFANSTGVVYFYSGGCPSCRVQDRENPKIVPQLDDLGVRYVKLKPNGKTIRKYGLTHFPTIVVFSNGREYKRWVGVTYADMLIPVVRGAVSR